MTFVNEVVIQKEARPPTAALGLYSYSYSCIKHVVNVICALNMNILCSL